MKDYNFTIKQKQKKAPDIGALKAKLDKLTDLYLSDLITKEKYAEEFQRISGRITEAENTPKPIDATEVKTLLQAYTGLSEAAEKAFWSRLLNRIELDPEGENHSLIYTNGYIPHDILRFVKMRSFEKC